ncbi:MAG: hypothetical protein U5J97_06060 [Trueperaceae bacterium]|nr:hypothetical protein [Trueperaceae bacterium]
MKNDRRGLILVAVLSGGVALLLIATFTLTVALLQLQGAEYQQRMQRARATAEAGVVLLDAVLRERWSRGEGLPDTAPPLPGGHGLELRVIGYRPLAVGLVEVEVEGGEAGAIAVAGAELRYP